MSKKYLYNVITEKNTEHLLYADSFADAIEEYYHSLESTIGHTLKICSCFGDPKPIDRTKVIKPIRVELLNEPENSDVTLAKIKDEK